MQESNGDANQFISRRKRAANVLILSCQQAVAFESYKTDQTKPLQLRTGEEILISERKSEWKGWIWCVDRMGMGGWVPESYLAQNNNGVFSKYEYSARELKIIVGEILLMGRRESGRVWCTNTHGESGWVPENCLHIL